MKSFKQFKNTKGITLIALVVTIVVLLILAAVSISMLTGENGIITQAKDSKDKTEQTKCEELVAVAINGLIAENGGDRSKITPEKIAEQVNKENNRDDVTAEGSTFPTNIIFNEEGRKVGVDIELGVTEEIKEEIYNADVSEEDIAPASLFDYEIIDEAETSALEMLTLPTKCAKITGIKREYCNVGEWWMDTNYKINFEGITNTLIIPYQVSGEFIEGADENEMYKITEVDLSVYSSKEEVYERWASLPDIETIIYPNTVEVIYGHNYAPERLYSRINAESTLKRVIFSENMKEIPEMFLVGALNLETVKIPHKISAIQTGTFCGCEKLTNITIPDNVTNIGKSAFSGCSSLTDITIPSSVISIGNFAFDGCSSLTSITISNSVTSIGNSVFNNCSSLTTVNYTGTEEEWNKMSISSGNTYLTNATINYNYKGE